MNGAWIEYSVIEGELPFRGSFAFQFHLFHNACDRNVIFNKVLSKMENPKQSPLPITTASFRMTTEALIGRIFNRFQNGGHLLGWVENSYFFRFLVLIENREFDPSL